MTFTRLFKRALMHARKTKKIKTHKDFYKMTLLASTLAINQIYSTLVVQEDTYSDLSPFVSKSHMVWLDEVIKTFNKKSFAQNHYRKMFANRGLANSLLLSRRVFVRHWSNIYEFREFSGRVDLITLALL
jgi:hypothetical protein